MLRGKSNVLRIIDANLNRALEALRVLEEAARLVLDSESLSKQAKQLRHRLSGALGSFAPLLHSARRIEKDVGTDISTDSERNRGSTTEVIRANASRLKESLRVLEEYSKTLNAGTAESLQNVRYKSYTLEKKLLLAFSPRAHLTDVLLIAIVSETDPLGAEETARLAISGGADAIQLREKGVADRNLLETAFNLRRITEKGSVFFLVNDSVDVAAACGADGVHVGKDDLPVDETRRLLGPGKIIGASAHSTEEGIAAQEQGADYLGIGSLFSTSTKDNAVLRGPECFLEVRDAVSVPCFAIGGITIENVNQAVKAGVERVAVASGISRAISPKEAARGIKTALLSVRTGSKQST
jgi:thiamine-phosphate pyrophosphorylase